MKPTRWLFPWSFRRGPTDGRSARTADPPRGPRHLLVLAGAVPDQPGRVVVGDRAHHRALRGRGPGRAEVGVLAPADLGHRRVCGPGGRLARAPAPHRQPGAVSLAHLAGAADAGAGVRAGHQRGPAVARVRAGQPAAGRAGEGVVHHPEREPAGPRRGQPAQVAGHGRLAAPDRHPRRAGDGAAGPRHLAGVLGCVGGDDLLVRHAGHLPAGGRQRRGQRGDHVLFGHGGAPGLALGRLPAGAAGAAVLGALVHPGQGDHAGGERRLGHCHPHLLGPAEGLPAGPGDGVLQARRARLQRRVPDAAVEALRHREIWNFSVFII
jgi:hypothetical protein